MICNPCIGYEDLGFLPNKHYIKSDPDQLLEIIKYWLKDPKAQTIASNARDLVLSKHSMKARGKQIKNCFKKILKDDFVSAKWKKGKYVIK